MTTPENPRLPVPPFDSDTAIKKVRLAEDAWNSRDPEKVAGAYTVGSGWRNRSEFLSGRGVGFQVAAIARGPEKESLARKLGAHHYIDSNAQDPVAALQTLGGARLILATAANSKVSLKASELMIEIGHWKRSS